jgi:hypothetical protein
VILVGPRSSISTRPSIPALTLGIEFLAWRPAEGRTTLHRLKDIVEIYERENDRLANA